EPEDYRYTELMLTEVDRLNRVISKLLAYSKPREPRLTIRSVEEIVDHCVRVVEREAVEAGVQITTSSTEQDIPLVLVDSDQMTQVFLNILINAIEATSKGGKVNVKFFTDGQGRLRIVTEDTGQGIPRENIDKLFDPFFSTKKKGTGLGLAIVKSIIEGHGGEIEVESDSNGARFVVILNPYQPRQENSLEQHEVAFPQASIV
ncbi:MAG: two-component system sensor histidine kinase NtrB, partial [Desulfomonilaceae bacterium]